jgi:D-glycero-D-manno-heptose 1,7-bisphosphate phosphatase
MDRAHLSEAPLETIEEGLYRRLNADCRTIAPGRPALFLDRDGVLLRETHYLWRPSDAAFLNGAVEALRRINATGVTVVLVTNQAGIARGYFGWPEFQALQASVEERLADEGAHLDALYACAYHAEGHGALKVAGHPWRKPKPGMLTQAAADLEIDLAGSWMIGDHVQDVQAGLAAGLAGVVHVATGHGARFRPEVEALAPEFDTEILTADDLAEAVGRALAGVQSANR